jgi:hypothetical protein
MLLHSKESPSCFRVQPQPISRHRVVREGHTNPTLTVEAQETAVDSVMLTTMRNGRNDGTYAVWYTAGEVAVLSAPLEIRVVHEDSGVEIAGSPFVVRWCKPFTGRLVASIGAPGCEPVGDWAEDAQPCIGSVVSIMIYRIWGGEEMTGSVWHVRCGPWLTCA